MSVSIVKVDVPNFVKIHKAVTTVDVGVDISFNLMDMTVKVNTYSVVLLTTDSLCSYLAMYICTYLRQVPTTACLFATYIYYVVTI